METGDECEDPGGVLTSLESVDETRSSFGLHSSQLLEESTEVRASEHFTVPLSTELPLEEDPNAEVIISPQHELSDVPSLSLLEEYSQWQAGIQEGLDYLNQPFVSDYSWPYDIGSWLLRHLISAPSRNDIFYAAGSQVIHVNTSTPSTKPIIDFHTPSSSSSSRATPPFNITTLAATPAVLLTASFTGEYAYLPLSSPSTTLPTLGRVTPTPTDITNHIHASASRSLPPTTPLATFSSNDQHLRVLSTATNRLLASFAYPAALNASALSPDARLRALVSDASTPWITDAETGEVVVELGGGGGRGGVHQDAGFAVAWADDGVTVATAGQDEKVVLWDARRWGEPLGMLRSRMAAPRALAFSPVGSGRRVLVVGEAEDVVGVVEMDGGAEWARRDIEFFGSVGGVAMGPDGEELWVANCDATVGGLMEFERCGEEGARDWVEDPERDVRTARRKAERRYRFRDPGLVVV
ncbi:MAG: hypothetical protein Q9165_008601 [Trypethelium subeluteriae]